MRYDDRSPLLPSRSSSVSKKSLADAGWQERVQRHCVEHLADICPFVQILDADAPLPIEQCAEIWNLEDDIMGPARLHDRHVAEQVIDVPTFSCSPCPSRVPVSEPQTAEQLLEVLTPFYFFEQNVDIPVSQVGVARGGQQGFLSGQGSVGVQNVDIPASGSGVSGGLHVSPPRQSTSQRTAVQIADIPVPGRGGLGRDFPSRRAGPRFVLPRQGSTAAGAEQIADIPSSGGPHGFLPRQVSTAFPEADHGHDSYGGGGAVVGPQGSVPGQSSPARRVDAPVADSSEWVQFRDAATGKPYHWNRRTNVTA